METSDTEREKIAKQTWRRQSDMEKWKANNEGTLWEGEHENKAERQTEMHNYGESVINTSGFMQKQLFFSRPLEINA